MKYLSNIKLVLTKREVRTIKKELKKVKSNLWDVKDYVEEFKGLDGKKYVEICWNNTEWFLKYIDIFAIYKTLSKFKATGIPFDFYKIGENPNDIEHYYCDTEDFAISNKFVLDKILQPV